MRIWVAIAVACGHASAEPKLTVFDATAILTKSAAVYATATSYADRGTVAVAYVEGAERRVVEDTFTTAYRPPMFRFEYRDEDDAKRDQVIWSDGKQTLARWYVEPSVMHEISLVMAIAGATGVSNGVAHNIPTLLMSEIGGWSPLDLNNVRLVGAEAVDGHPCWKLVGAHPLTRDEDQLWIDERTYLIRRMAEHHHFPRDMNYREFDAETTITFDPVVNGSVAGGQLARPATRPNPQERPRDRTSPIVKYFDRR